MTFETIEQIKDFVYSRIVRDWNVTIYNDDAINKLYLDFFENLDNPQQKIKVIHVAGTSGKGSTCNFISNALVSQGFLVGMTISPFIQCFQERIQINNKNLDDQKFIDYFNQVYRILVDTEQVSNLKLSTFEILTGLTIWSFWQEGVDYAVVEVGMGGRLDGTNVINHDKLCVINSIGLDHQRFLGDTLELIAGEKAGIMQKGNLALALSQSKEINQVFQTKAYTVGIELEYLFPKMDFESPVLSYDKLTGNPKLNFDYTDFELEQHSFSLTQIGDYQAENCALAVRSVEMVADRDEWEIDWKTLTKAIKQTNFKARFQIIENNKNKLIIDGAHNVQKMRAFVSSVAKYYPNQKFNWIIGFKADKDVNEILNIILANTANINKIILTQFDVTITNLAEQVIISKRVEEMQTYLLNKRFDQIQIETSLTKAVDKIKISQEDFIITGSLYLAGAVLNILDQKK